MALLLVVLPRLLPDEAPPPAQGTIELLMLEQKGAEPSQAGQPKASTAVSKQADKTEAAKPELQPAKPPPPQPPAAPEHAASPPAGEPAPTRPDAASTPPAAQPTDAPTPPAEATPSPNQPAEPAAAAAKAAPAQQQPAEAQPAPAAPGNAPVMDLGGTDSPSNAAVLGDQVLPAKKDDRFRNRPPVYPIEAEVHGQHGTVVIVIHVSDNGIAAGVDILESSGYDVLDEAVVTAVRKWHFRPALKEGQPVPFDMPFRFVFEP